jgi:polar amino acid transport system substrate-binding protein
MRLLPAVLSAVTLLLASLAPAQACQNVARVGVSELGYASYQNGSQVEGISVDLVKEMARRAGCKVEFVWFPRDRLLIEYSSDRIDIAMAALRTPQVDKLAQFLPYGYTQYELLLPRRAGVTTLADYIDGGSGTLVAHRGQTFTPVIRAQLARLDKAGRLEWQSDFDALFKRVAASRNDATIATPAVSLWYRKRIANADELMAFEMSEGPRQFVGMYLSRKNLPAASRKALATALRSIVEDGTLLKIYGSYLDEATVKRLFRNEIKQLAQAIPAQ